MVQWFRTLAALTEDPGSMCITHIRQLTTNCNSSFRGSDAFSPLWVPAHICVYMHEHTHITLKLNKILSNTKEKQNSYIAVPVHNLPNLNNSMTDLSYWEVYVYVRVHSRCGLCSSCDYAGSLCHTSSSSRNPSAYLYSSLPPPSSVVSGISSATHKK